jgi:aryl-alcohol dehydrogenase-like predicted oxidoreductase
VPPPSRIGLGLAALGRPGYINLGHRADLGGDTDVSALEARSHEVMDAARAAGISYFDAARSYGRAEAFLSSWLDSRGIEPGEVTVASKWGYVYTADWRIDAEQHEVKDLSVENLRRQAEESRALLGDHLRLYQIHSATLESGVFEDTAVREELERLRAAGLEIGFTSSGPRQRETIERALEVGGFDAVQATWNLLERSAPDRNRVRCGRHRRCAGATVGRRRPQRGGDRRARPEQRARARPRLRRAPGHRARGPGRGSGDVLVDSCRPPLELITAKGA